MKRRGMLIFGGAIALSFVALSLMTYTFWKMNSNSQEVIEQQLEELEQLQSQLPQEGGAEVTPPEPPVSDAKYRFPIAESDYVTLTSPFGYRVSPILGVEKYHQGLDIAASWRAQVVAIADGIVVEHWPPPDGYYRGHDVYGGLLVVEHENGWQSVYAHLSWTRVNTGDRVRSGEVIGRVGGTGKSRGEHLHIELIDATGQNVNPLLYFEPKEFENE